MSHRNKGWLLVAEGIGLAVLWAFVASRGNEVFYLFAVVSVCVSAFVAAVNLGWINP